MELKVFWSALRRRWYLTVVVVLLTLTAIGYAVSAVGPTYKAEGSALVFPPTSTSQSESGTKTVGNPYLELSGVNQARDVIIRTLTSRTVRTDWEATYPDMSYEATPDYTNSAPIILFTVEGDTPSGSAAALADLMARVPTILVDLQDGMGLSQDGLVTARTLTQDTRPAVVHKTQIRAGLLAAAIASGLGLLLLALIDSLISARTRHRPEALDDVVDADTDEAPVRPERGRVDSEMAISPARSQWPRAVGSVDPGRTPARGLETATLVVPTRSRSVGRDR